MASKIALSDMLGAIDKNDIYFYRNLDEEQKKEFSSWMAMRWASSATGDALLHHIMMTNEIVNKDFSVIAKHPELQWMLLAITGTGSKQRHEWIKPPRGKKKNKVQTFLREIYPDMKDEDLELLEQINSVKELKELAADHGYQKSDIKDIFK